MVIMTNLCLVECKTRTGEHCVFPFYYNGSNHYACITHDNDGTPWCNVNTTDGVIVKENCMSDCPGNFAMTMQFDLDYAVLLFS